jgi:hypothetical protein
LRRHNVEQQTYNWTRYRLRQLGDIRRDPPRASFYQGGDGMDRNHDHHEKNDL